MPAHRAHMHASSHPPRGRGHAHVYQVLDPKKPKWIFKHADRAGVAHVVLFAPREAEGGMCRVKRMADGEQADVAIEGLADWFASASAAPEAEEA